MVAAEEEEVVEVDVEWDVEGEEEVLVEVAPEAEAVQQGVVVVEEVEEGSTVLREEKPEAMVAESDLEHRQQSIEPVDSVCTYIMIDA